MFHLFEMFVLFREKQNQLTHFLNLSVTSINWVTPLFCLELLTTLVNTQTVTYSIVTINS